MVGITKITLVPTYIPAYVVGLDTNLADWETLYIVGGLRIELQNSPHKASGSIYTRQTSH